mgnify:CR=1 FL=1
MIKLVLVRHGQSEWNLENKFTGWTDVNLSEKGIQEAKEAGEVLKKKGFKFDLAYTSVLKRAEDTLDYILHEMGEENIEIKRSWRLNERHYGALQGLNKDETREKYGAEQVLLWRRSTTKNRKFNRYYKKSIKLLEFWYRTRVRKRQKDNNCSTWK